MFRLKTVFVSLMILCQFSGAWANEPLVYSANAIYTAVQIGANQRFYQRALANHSYVVRNLRGLQGAVGESVMHTMLTDRHLGGSWRQINPKFGQPGPHGFDGFYVKYEKGHPKELFIGEAKYNSSRLAPTDGGQMGTRWVGKRLATQVNAFGQAANAVGRGDIEYASAPTGENTNLLRLRVKDRSGNNRRVLFWWEKKGGHNVLNVDTNGRDISKESIHETLKEHQKLFQSNLDALKHGDIPYRGRIYKNIKFAGNDVSYIIIDAATNQKIDKIDTRNLSDKQRIRILANVRKAAGDFIAHRLGISRQNAREIVKILSKKLPMAELLSTKGNKALRQEIIKAQVENGVSCQEARRRADKLLKPTAESQRAVRREFALHTARGAAVAGVMGFLIDAATQFWRTGQVDLGRTAKTAAFTMVSSFVGQYAGHYALNTSIGQSVISRTARLLHVRVGTVAEVGGGIVSSLIGAYGAYALGLTDLATANRTVLTSAVALVGSKAVVAGVTWTVSTFGTAGTGTAIAALSGGAASNATYAWIGKAAGASLLKGMGISISSMAVGGFVLGGIGIFASILIGSFISSSGEGLSAEQMAQQRELMRGHLDIAQLSL